MCQCQRKVSTPLKLIFCRAEENEMYKKLQVGVKDQMDKAKVQYDQAKVKAIEQYDIAKVKAKE